MAGVIIMKRTDHMMIILGIENQPRLKPKVACENAKIQRRLFFIFLKTGLINFLICAGCAPEVQPSKKANPINPMAIILAPHPGAGKLDLEIRQLQAQVREGKRVDISIERLGWAFVSKARDTFDPGFYKLAEQCALALDPRQPQCPEALLLRGHALHNLHKFKEAERVGRQLVSKRALPFDFGLLSDALMEQGKIAEAVEACQKMIDLRPDLHSYARGAHLRWLKGDLKGAEKLMRQGGDASTPRDADSAAWVFTRLGGYQFQLGAFSDAEQSCAGALELRPEYPPALLLEGRILLSKRQNEHACEFLRRAAVLNPLPEYQWTLAEALRAAYRFDEAAKVELELTGKGELIDPRTVSIYLATRNESADLALRLAKEEMLSRSDIFSHDALAWAFASAGKLVEAKRESALALEEGTKDARLLYHAAMVAAKSGAAKEAKLFAAEAELYKQTLLPSERAQLDNLRRDLASSSLPMYSGK
jgi:tetratricopeptide (TPR) repeat protein